MKILFLADLHNCYQPLWLNFLNKKEELEEKKNYKIYNIYNSLLSDKTFNSL